MREHWHHAGGCRSWLLVERDNATHEIFAVEAARDATRGPRK
jgi:sarcosine oxidase subunit delta